MKAAKYLLFLFAIAGVAGLFLPAVQISAFGQTATGPSFFDGIQNINLNEKPDQMVAGMMGSMVLLLLVAAVSTMKRFNPLLALLAIVFGGTGGWMWYSTPMGEMLTNSPGMIGMGGWLMTASPLGGVIFGLMGLIKPEPKDDDKKKKDKKKDKK